MREHSMDGSHDDDDTISLITPPSNAAIDSGQHRIVTPPTTGTRATERVPSRARSHDLLVIAEDRSLQGALAELAEGRGVGQWNVTLATEAANAMALLKDRSWHCYLFDEASYGLLSWLPEDERLRVQRRSVVVTSLDAAGPAALTAAACVPASRLTRFSLDNALWQVVRHQRPQPGKAPYEESIYDALLRLARTDLGRPQDTAAALAPLVESAARALKVGRVTVWMLTEAPRRLKLMAMWDAGAKELTSGLEVPVSLCPVYCMSLHNHRIMAVQDALRDPRTSELADFYLCQAGIGALLDAPIYLDGALAGVLCCAHVGGPREWTEAEARAAASFADYAQLVLTAHRRRRAEEELIAREAAFAEAQKLEALGRLAGGIAHDFNNLLTVIGGRVQVLERTLGSDPRCEQHVAPVLAACRRAGDMVQQLLSYARRAPRSMGPVDVNAVAEEACAMLERTLDRRVSVRCRLSARPATIHGDASELHRALVNLGVNAGDAMPDGGTLTVTSRVVSGRSGARLLELVVADTGTGMSPEVKARALEPFFTTKGDGRGTGLGLAVVDGCVREHQGTLDIETTPGDGTSVRLRFPLAADAPAPTAPEAAPAAGSGHGQVLLIESDADVRSTVATMLSFLGYSVEECDTAFEGIRRLGERRGAIDLVLLDLAMPDMAGRDCYRALRLIDHRLRCLVISGGDDQTSVDECLGAGAVGALRKPLAMAALAQAVEGALSKRSAAS